MWEVFVKKKNTKKEVLRRGLVKWAFDIFGMAETNIDWRIMKVEDRLPLRTKEWWDSQHVCWAYNTMGSPRAARQFCGTVLFLVNKASHKVVDKGQDTSGLGRWR
jgi:hypothetical protein